jgi:glycosyltransferase involved in cell wall biosynthesis
LTAILPARNPNPTRWARVFAALAAQTLGRPEWEIVIVDNASDQPCDPPPGIGLLPVWRRVVEPELGLTPARLRGLAEARGAVVVFVDDDNVLAPGHLAAAAQHFAENPRLGAAGGPVVPEFEVPPPEWTREFHGLLALCDHGPAPKLARGGPDATWPGFAPVGAGLCVRRESANLYIRALEQDPSRRRLDRAGRSLASGGDNDLVFTLLQGGWDVGCFPELRVTHLIPPGRLAADYLARLNEGIQRTWVHVLALHGQHPWQPVASWTVPLRSARAWLRTAAWRAPANRVRWRGLVGRFRGQADLVARPAPALTTSQHDA